MTRATLLALALFAAPAAAADTPAPHSGGEANLVLPDLDSVEFLGGVGGKMLLGIGLAVSVLGLVFGLAIYTQLKNMPVHESMLEVSELIYETCKTYLFTQGKFLFVLWLFVGTIIGVYYGVLTEFTDPATGEVRQGFPPARIAIILAFSVVGILGSYGVAWFGIRVNTFANSRTAFAALTGKAYPCYAIPLKAGISIGMLLISVELLLMLIILMFIPGELAGACFIGFAVGESLGAAALRVAGGIFTKIADIGADLMKIVFGIKEDDARNPGVIADCTGDNAGDSVGPSADGFETYGVTGIALITFDSAGRPGYDRPGAIARLDFHAPGDDGRRVRRVVLRQRSAGQSQVQRNGRLQLRSPANRPRLVDLDRVGRPDLRRVGPADPTVAGSSDLWWQLSTIITCRDAGRGDHSGVRESVHQHRERARQGSGHLFSPGRGVVEHPQWPGRRELLGVLARHHHSRADGHCLRDEYAIAAGPDARPAVFAFGLVAFGFLGMGPVTIAVEVTARSPTTPRASTNSAASRPSTASTGSCSGTSSFRRTSSWLRTIWRRTTGPGTRSRRRPSRYSSARPWSARRR